jgi:excisionase family DNA binding protein
MINRGLLTVKELSSYLGVSPCTVYRMVEKGEVPLIRRQGLGLRFQKEAIDVWLDKSSKKPVPILDGSVHPLTMPPVCHIKGSHDQTGGTREMAKAKFKTRYSSVYGAIYQRKTKDGRIRWYLDYRDELGKRIQRVAVNAQTAEEAGLALQTEVRRVFDRAQGVKEKKQIVFSDLAKLYIDNYAKSNKRSWRCDDYCIDAHLKPFFGKKDLGEISPLDVEAYRAQRLEAGIKKSTSNRELALLKRMFHLASDWGYAGGNPVTKVKLFSERDNLKERVLTADEETRLLAHCAPHLRPIVVFALNTGMRRGEILGLRWDQIDASGRSVRVTRTKGGRDRIVPLNDAAAGVVKAQRKTSHGSHVFPSMKGREFMRTVDHSFGRACRLAGIVGLRFHDLRHTFATRLIRRGADIITVQALLGHYSVTVTQRYTHSGADEKRRAVEALSRASESLLHGGDTPVTEKSGVQVTRSSAVN